MRELRLIINKTSFYHYTCTLVLRDGNEITGQGATIAKAMHSLADAINSLESID